MMNLGWRHLSTGWRQLWRNRSVVWPSVAMLSLGTAVALTVWSLALGVLQIPFANPDRVVFLSSSNEQAGGRPVSASWNDFLYWREHARTVRRLTGCEGRYFLLAGDPPERVWGAIVTDDFFRLAGGAPRVGRVFNASDGDQSQTMVLSFRFWQRRFGGDPGIIGRTVTIDREPATVIGVMPNDFWSPSPQVEMWLRFLPARPHGAPALVVGELAPTADIRQVRAELTTLARNLDHERPIAGLQRGVTVRHSVLEMLGSSDATALALVMLAGVGVLLLSGLNAGNLLMAGGLARAREFATRIALGASRRQLMTQLMIEAIPLGVVTAVVSVLVAGWSRPLLLAQITGAPPKAGIDLVLVAGAVAPVMLALVLAAALPSLVVTRLGLSHLQAGGMHSTAAPGRRRVYRILVGAQLAVALALVVTAFSFVVTLRGFYVLDPGFLTTGVTTMRLELPEAERRAFMLEQAIGRVAAMPGVSAVAASNHAPFAGSTGGAPVEWVIVTAPDGHDALCSVGARVQAVSRTYFDALRIRVRGRGVDTDSDVAVIDTAFVQRCAAEVNLLGSFVRLGDHGETRLPIVGVAAGVRNVHPAIEPQPQIYVPYRLRPVASVVLFVRGPGVAAMGERVRDEMRRLSPAITVYDSRSLAQSLDRLLAAPWVLVELLSVLGGLALALAVVGVYAIMSEAATRRAREVAIRIALGASPSAAMRLLLSDGTRLVLASAGVGLCAALAIGIVVGAIIPLIKTTDARVFGVGAAVVAVVGILASYVPARRMTRVDPVSLLRAE